MISDEIAKANILDSVIAHESVVSFVYRGVVPSTRIVSPYELRPAAFHGHLNLLGYDHVRDGLRMFALDKISSLQSEPAYTFAEGE